MNLLLLELALFVAVAVAGWFGAGWAVEGTIASAGFRDLTGDALAVQAAGREAAGWFVGGVAVVAIARVLTALRKGRHVRTPLLLPAVFGAAGLGLAVQLGYGNPYASSWPGPAFGVGVFVAGCVAAAILALPGDVAAWVSRGRHVLGGGAIAVFLVLALFGDAPGASDAKVNLGPVQPIEGVKVAVALWLADDLGRRAGKLRWQRAKAGVLRVPRPSLLLPALAALLLSFAGLFLVKDFGPTLILGLVFLALFTLVTRSPGWAGLAVATLAIGLAGFALFPDAVPSATVATRLRMWTDPWLNGLAHGDQLARARWALAAGGLTGSGFGASEPGALPAGHTDLVFAHLVEELGLAGAATWLVLVGVAVTDGLRVAARNRTPERALMAAALAFLIVAQCAVILGGTLGVIPLTGVVVPFLSYGKTSMAAFVGIAALIARLGEDAEARADTDELKELRAGVVGAQVTVGVLAAVALAVTAGEAHLRRDETTLRGVVTTLGDGTPTVQHDPRLATIAAQVRRGSILDRDGRVLAESPTPDLRLYPLGDALGTVLGPADAGMLRPRWSVERQADATLRGWPDLADGPAMWLGKLAAGERLLLAVPSAAREAPGERAEALRRFHARGGEGEAVRRLALAAPDLSPLLPIARLPLAERKAAVAKLSADTASRSVRLTLDARLQAAVAKQVREAAKKSAVGAAALVVMDPATGEVLARAQWPDYDPAAADWRPKRLAHDAQFMGIYGPWSDKTGAHGVWQAGSVFKLLTSLAAVREGFTARDDLTQAASVATTCVTEAPPSFACNDVTEGRTSFRLPDWEKPIHDFGDGGARGDVDLIEGITRSSNVYFGQLALKLGPEPYRKLREAGVEFGNPALLDEKDGPFTGIGEAGSRRLAQTGFGQGAGSWNVTQAARVVSAIATGGTYRRCGAEMRAGEACAETKLLDGQSVGPILAGMRGVMTRGTGARLGSVDGLRIYGKTGTADAPGTRDEAPWKIRPGQATQPHSWFVAIAEPDTLPECGDNAGRLVVAAVVPHGGFGASAAGPLAMAAIREAKALGLVGAAKTDAPETP